MSSKIIPYSAITYDKFYDKFEEKYLILCIYSYLNHPHYNNFVQYLNSSNKIAVIFCTSDVEMFNIINSDLILKYKVYDLIGRDKILKELQADFDAIQVDYRVDDDDYDENGLISYLSRDTEIIVTNLDGYPMSNIMTDPYECPSGRKFE